MPKYQHFYPTPNYTHLSEYCRRPECVFGFIDWFDMNNNYLTTTVCAVCKPDTYDLIQAFPNVGNRSEHQQRMLAQKREELGTKKAASRGFQR